MRRRILTSRWQEARGFGGNTSGYLVSLVETSAVVRREMSEVRGYVAFRASTEVLAQASSLRFPALRRARGKRSLHALTAPVSTAKTRRHLQGCVSRCRRTCPLGAKSADGRRA